MRSKALEDTLLQETKGKRFCFANGKIQHGDCRLKVEKSHPGAGHKVSNRNIDGWPSRLCQVFAETLFI